jgi:hypothetical protein
MVMERKALWVVFRPEKLDSTAEMREKFKGAYSIFRDMPGLLSKCWWCNQEKGEWGALYIFNSEKDLQEYITSDLWLNKVPAKYGCKAEITILEPGPIMCKKIFTEAENSWITE